MIRNEIRLFFSKRNVLVWICAAAALLFIYQFYYIRNYENYGRMKQEEILAQAETVDLAVMRYQDWLDYYQENEPDSEKIAPIKELLSIWQISRAERNLMADYWGNWETREDVIRQMDTQMDERLIDAPDDYDYMGTVLYRGSRREWKQRLMLSDAYEAAGEKRPVNELTPDGSYVLWDALGGVGVVFLIFAVLILIWNYDIWGADFENGTDKLVYTLPCARTKLFWTRFLIRWFFGMAGIGLLLALLFVRGTISFGTGFDRFVIINQNVWNSFSFTVFGEGTEVVDTVLSIAPAIGIRLGLSLLFLTFFMALVSLVSFALKNGTAALTFVVAFMMLEVSSVLLANASGTQAGWLLEANYNPCLYFQIDAAMNGGLGTGLPMMALVEGILIVVLLTGTERFMRYREL